MATFTQAQKFDLFRILRVTPANRVDFFKWLTSTVQIDDDWHAAVMVEYNYYTRGENDPNVFLKGDKTATATASDTTYEPYLKKVDVVEYFEGLQKETFEINRDRALQGLVSIVAYTPPEGSGSSVIGLGYNFS